MRVLQLGKFYPIKGGVEKVMYDLTVGLSENDIYTDMLCASNTNNRIELSLNSKSKINARKTLCILFSTYISIDLIVHLRKHCNNYDIIHVHHPDPMAALALFFSGYRGKVVLHWHSDIVSQKIMLMVYKPLQSWLLKRSNKIVGTTPVYLKNSSDLKNFLNKSVSIPIGIDKVEYSYDQVLELRKTYNNKFIIFSLGRLVEYKGFDYLIESAKYLDDKYIILIGGDGPLKEKLNDKIKSNNLQEKVILLGRLNDDEVKTYYGLCDVFCLSSIMKTEAFGIVQIEAMSCGKPVVATNIIGSGVSWVNSHLNSGINVEPMDSQGLANAFISLSTNTYSFNSYKANSLERYNKLFRKESMIDSCIKLYKSIL